jgi:ubiquinone/menaquinone biosynthesis C-methylase UbiE
VTRPISIENRWDILYRDYPEVYDAFSKTPYHPTIYEQLPTVVNLQDKVIADIGAGTGESSLALARYARSVIGIENELAMLNQAREKTRIAGSDRVTFLAGDALSLPLADASVSLVIGITLALYPPALYRGYIVEGMRVATEQVVYLGIPPGWYGGELAQVIGFQSHDLAVDRIFLDEFNFSYCDIFTVQEFGSLEHIVNTFGFIFGKQAIAYLEHEKKTSIRWKFRIYFRSVL